jgi:5-hydroxyisourate hydrolase-like protein (transthyretin family)
MRFKTVAVISMCVVAIAWSNAVGKTSTQVEVNVGQVHALAGHVSDPTGVPMPGVLVTRISEDGQKDIESTKTDGEGRYSFDVPDGRYTIRLEASGFKDTIIHATVMHKLHKNLDVTLSIGH